MNRTRLLVGVLVGGALALASTHAAHGGSVDWAIFSPFTFPGILVASPSAALHGSAFADEVEKTNLWLVDGVDFVFYSALFCWLLSRWGVTRE